ncbi:MAG TPA: RsiV family protein, partial [Rhodothermales bacterium]|nr:RsiV family protein [Rhodothermales bacterium]
ARAMVALYRPPGPLPAELLELNPDFEAFVEGGFETDLVRDSLYSGLLAAYAFTGGAHGNQDFRPLNVDLRTGRTLTLPSFFRADAAWRDTLAANSTRRLVASLGPDVLFDGAVPADDPAVFRVFTLAPDSLVLHFPPYAVAPYVAGPQRVAVAWSSLRPLLDPAGPARYFVTDRPSR